MAGLSDIGPNGAGKSTTIKMLIGILVPSSGRVRVDGRDPSRERVTVARRIGVVFGQRTQLWWDLRLQDPPAMTARSHTRRPGTAINRSSTPHPDTRETNPNTAAQTRPPAQPRNCAARVTVVIAAWGSGREGGLRRR
jgi:ABC-type branched-subunit amino acid transport system ATPase component